MIDEVLQTIISPDGERRVHIVRRTNGAFGFEEEQFSDLPEEMCWLACSQRPFSICDSEEAAMREATGRIEWLMKQEST